MLADDEDPREGRWLRLVIEAGKSGYELGGISSPVRVMGANELASLSAPFGLTHLGAGSSYSSTTTFSSTVTVCLTDIEVGVDPTGTGSTSSWPPAASSTVVADNVSSTGN
ncbi:MAG: hypothetical protein M3446_11705, partial [Actinomycetota bacterium]|nr:hypothetical protein [Actinomycetota bacterium]